ncbi:MAG: hypothetical protein ACOVQ0_20145 [Novosphingobium sp.]|uniref:hypothetical protein n=1 Tax=Novosphingobium sp. TaxID=1874826 RepID=UPI003B9AFDDF
MRYLLAASAMSLALASTPALIVAQTATTTTPPATSTMPDSTAPAAPQDTTAPVEAAPFAPAADQQAQIDAWPAEQKTKYAAWPSTYQEYFWTLDAEQQKGWWALTDEQKGQVYAMTPDQRTQVWPSIIAQVNGQSASAATMPPANGAQPAPSSMAENRAVEAPKDAMTADAGAAATATGNAPASDTVGTMMASNAAPSAAAKEYPICSKTVQDSCRNRGGV